MHLPSNLPSIRALGRARAAGLALLVVAAVALAACSSSSTPTASDPNAQGTALVNQFFTILQQPDAAKADQLKSFIAPEFQVVRANGDQVARDAYLTSAPKVATYAIDNVQATQGGDVLVVSYKIHTSETVNGVEQTTTAPRLSVFRYMDGAWKLAAHSNFGAVTQ